MFGWQNSATYGSVISYNLYWLVVIVGFGYMGWKEGKTSVPAGDEVSDTDSAERNIVGKKTSEEGVVVGTEVREVR